MTGFITKQRYKYATVYVDQASGFGYVHLQRTASAEETIESKTAFERLARTHGVVIHGYHADNGIFKASAWVNQCKAKDQQLTFAGVGAHHTNGMAERRIRELQEMARTMLIHANKRWPQAIDAHLCGWRSYTLKMMKIILRWELGCALWKSSAFACARARWAHPAQNEQDLP